MPVQSREQQLARRHISNLLQRIHLSAHRVVGVNSRVDEATAALNQHETANAQFTQQAAGNVGRNIIALLCVPAAYFVDFKLLAPSIEFLVGGAAEPPDWTTRLAQAVTPAALLLIEAGIASRRQLAEEEAAEYGSRGPLWFWTILGLLPATLAATFAVATQLALAQKDDTALAATSLALFIGLGGLAFLLHAFILLNSRSLHEAEAFGVFKVGQTMARWKVARLSNQRDRLREALINAFTEYLHRLNNYNATYATDRVEAGPFDAAAREQVNGLWGHEIIQRPSDAGGAANPAAATPPPTNAANQTPPNQQTAAPQSPTSNGPEDHSNNASARAVRDRDSEVQP